MKREARKIMNDPSHSLHTRLFKSNNPDDLRTISSKNTLSRTERHKRSFLARANALTYSVYKKNATSEFPKKSTLF
jgi:hypothetical protein